MEDWKSKSVRSDIRSTKIRRMVNLNSRYVNFIFDVFDESTASSEDLFLDFLSTYFQRRFRVAYEFGLKVTPIQHRCIMSQHSITAN